MTPEPSPPGPRTSLVTNLSVVQPSSLHSRQHKKWFSLLFSPFYIPANKLFDCGQLVVMIRGRWLRGNGCNCSGSGCLCRVSLGTGHWWRRIGWHLLPCSSHLSASNNGTVELWGGQVIQLMAVHHHCSGYCTNREMEKPEKWLVIDVQKSLKICFVTFWSFHNLKMKTILLSESL